ncbi:WPE palindromic element domain-containing protein [Wolbachia endosymbiont (group A) of Beris morrisii]
MLCNKAHWDPENLTLNKWLHNKDWIPVSSTGMTPSQSEPVSAT